MNFRKKKNIDLSYKHSKARNAAFSFILYKLDTFTEKE